MASGIVKKCVSILIALSIDAIISGVEYWAIRRRYKRRGYQKRLH